MTTSIKRECTNRLASNIGRDTTLPGFPHSAKPTLITFDESLPNNILDGSFSHGIKSSLPYLNQNWYDRSQETKPIETIILENEHLKASFLPEWGGRLMSLYDKKKEKELLFDNPVLQPCNLAIRNAWFSGGIEFNGPVYGHTLQTCSPIYFAKLKQDEQTILRMYEYDRFLNTAWQVDFILEKDKLWYAVTYRNLNDYEVPFYWWTNIAVPVTGQTRFFSKQQYCVNHCVDQAIVPNSFPQYKGKDISYPDNAHEATSLFFVEPNEKMPWFAAIQEDGIGLAHASSPILIGKKYWYFGNFDGGLNWMDTLSLPNQGKYIEIQAGIKETQVQVSKIDANQNIFWVESVFGFEAGLEETHKEYETSLKYCEDLVGNKVTAEQITEKENWFKKIIYNEPDEVLYQASVWGTVQEKAQNIKLKGLPFKKEISVIEKPWVELIEQKMFSEQTLNSEPLSWNISTQWKNSLIESQTKNGNTWLHELHLGAIELSKENFTDSKAHFEKSIQLKPNFHAYRSLAFIAKDKKDFNNANSLYKQAWALSKNNEDLFLEILKFYKDTKQPLLVEGLIEQIPESLANHEEISLAKAALALEKKEYKKCRDLLIRPYTFVREGSFLTTNIWFQTFISEAEDNLGRKLTQEEVDKVKQENQPPKEIDFRMF